MCKSTARIQLYQEKRIEELGEESLGSMNDFVVCDSDLHTQFRGVLGPSNWLQWRTQFQSYYQQQHRHLEICLH
eukprot:12932805-Prorocentrum_lima.AAC.1